MSEYYIVHTKDGAIYIRDVVVNGVYYRKVEKLLPLDAVVIEGWPERRLLPIKKVPWNTNRFSAVAFMAVLVWRLFTLP